MHAGNCWDTGNRCTPASAEQIRELLTQGVAACIHCRPDTALGVLERAALPEVNEDEPGDLSLHPFRARCAE
ncbi:DUF6233 domain-containing protein [Streptomyces xanthophaeus]|uniref:DUF6233 domain-containing protein n=1 Tax=Streptomyces xanthophaeus TaxID=67385 RepID=UPI00365BC911